MFILKTTVEEDVLEHLRDVKTPKEACDTLLVLFSKKNETKLQLLENELMSLVQQDMTIPQYFHKVKSVCREISELNPQARIEEPRMKRIIIHGLKLEFRSFVAAIQGWPTQPSLVAFENLLTSQEELAKQMGRVSVKAEDEALYVGKGKSKYKPQSNHGNKRHNERFKKHDNKKQRELEKGDSSGEKKNHSSGKRFPFKCYNCGIRGHMAHNCPSESKEEGNTTITQEEEPWDAEACFAKDADVMAHCNC